MLRVSPTTTDHQCCLVCAPDRPTKGWCMVGRKVDRPMLFFNFILHQRQHNLGWFLCQANKPRMVHRWARDEQAKVCFVCILDTNGPSIFVRVRPGSTNQSWCTPVPGMKNQVLRLFISRHHRIILLASVNSLVKGGQTNFNEFVLARHQWTVDLVWSSLKSIGKNCFSFFGPI